MDLNRIDALAYIRIEKGVIAIGAMTRQRDAELAPLVGTRLPLLAEALRYVGHPQIRYRGTIGGSLAHAGDLFVGYLATSLEPVELLAEVRLPVSPPRMGWAFEELARRHGDLALVGVAATVRLLEDGRIANARIALTGCGPMPIRAADCFPT